MTACFTFFATLVPGGARGAGATVGLGGGSGVGIFGVMVAVEDEGGGSFAGGLLAEQPTHCQVPSSSLEPSPVHLRKIRVSSITVRYAQMEI